MTAADGAVYESKREKYAGKIDMLLERGFQHPTANGALPKARVKRVTYRRRSCLAKHDPLVTKGVASTTLIQYTPNNGDNTALVRIWNDDGLEPIYERTWARDD